MDELSKAGLSPKQIENLKPFVTIGAAASTAPAATTKETTTKKEAATAKESKPAKAATTKLAPGEKVNINTASKEQLEALPGIGPVKAQAIIESRPYQKTEDIMKVKGIKEGTFSRSRI